MNLRQKSKDIARYGGDFVGGNMSKPIDEMNAAELRLAIAQVRGATVFLSKKVELAVVTCNHNEPGQTIYTQPNLWRESDTVPVGWEIQFGIGSTRRTETQFNPTKLTDDALVLLDEIPGVKIILNTSKRATVVISDSNICQSSNDADIHDAFCIAACRAYLEWRGYEPTTSV